MLSTRCHFLLLMMVICPQAAEAAVKCQRIGGYDASTTSKYLSDITIDSTVTNFAELQQQIQAGAKKIYIPGDVTITLPNKSQALILHKGQKLISDRGLNGSQGARLVVEKGLDNLSSKYPLIVMNSETRITGFRIEGPVKGSQSYNKTIGIQFMPGSSNIQVDNNEIYYWPWAGVSVKTSKNNLVNNNYIHDNKKSGLGYGVVVQNGNNQVEISCNTFNANRHSIAGSGEDGDGYEAYHNLVLNGGEKAAYHAFDMHKGSTGHGGKKVVIEANIFDFGRPTTSNYSSVMLRGVPTSGKAIIQQNTFSQGWRLSNGTTAISQVTGATYSPETLQHRNSFNVPVRYSKTTTGCYVSYGEPTALSIAVDCQSIRSVLGNNEFQ